MLILYTKSSCPFCNRVKDYLQTTNISYDERDVYEREEWMDELLETGGKRQIPFLVDTEAGVQMYESADIIQYFKDRYASDSETSDPDEPMVCIPE